MVVTKLEKLIQITINVVTVILSYCGKKSFILIINSLSKVMSLKEFCLFLVLVSTTRANIQEIIKDCTMVPDVTPTVDKAHQWLKREDYSLWNFKIYCTVVCIIVRRLACL